MDRDKADSLRSNLYCRNMSTPSRQIIGCTLLCCWVPVHWPLQSAVAMGICAMRLSCRGFGQQFKTSKRRNTCWAFGGGFRQQFKRPNATIVFANGGGCAPPPQPPRLFEPGKLAWKHINHVQNKTKHGVLGLAPRHVTAMQMGGSCAPPNPPAFFCRASLRGSI